MPNELVEAEGSQLYVKGEVPLVTFTVPEPVAFVQVAWAVTLVMVGFGVTCNIMYLTVGPKQPPAGDIVKV